jgi:acetyl-CoA synthetase
MAVPKAYLVLAAGVTADRATALSIFRHLRERLAPFKRVRRLEFSELPKTISGKIRRVELRQTEERLAKEGRRAAGEFREEDFPELAAR